jgi:hypothetical protein
MTLVSTQPLTEMSNRNLPGSKEVKKDNVGVSMYGFCSVELALPTAEVHLENNPNSLPL